MDDFFERNLAFEPERLERQIATISGVRFFLAATGKDCFFTTRKISAPLVSLCKLQICNVLQEEIESPWILQIDKKILNCF